MTSAERALRVLIHDIRTAAGIAQGYARLLDQEHPDAPHLRDRAFRQSLGALTELARLADDAERLATALTAARMAVPIPRLVDRVRVRLAADAVDVVVGTLPEGIASLPPNVDGVADAVATVLQVAEGSEAVVGTVTVGASDGELWFARGAAGGTAAGGAEFDPWRVPGLSVAVACRTIEQSGGRVWVPARCPAGVGVAFPFEACP